MAHRAHQLSWLAIAVLGTVAGCASGQTGSPDCEGTTSCICEAVYQRMLLRGTVVSVAATGSDRSVTLTVEEVLNPQFSDWVVAGDLVGGVYSSGPSCAPNEYVATPGDQVLAVYERGNADSYPDCIEYRQCSSQNCGPEPSSVDSAWDACDGRCVADTFDACLLHRSEALASGRMWLSRWENEILLGEGYSVAAAEVPQIGTDQCSAYFPPPPPPPCNDTNNRLGCTLVTPTPASRRPLTVALAVAIGMARRRRRG